MPLAGRDRVEHLTNLELFVLAAVRSGLASAYDLKEKADLSVGTTIPLLQRLEQSGLLASKLAARRSRQYSLTSKGDRSLRVGWRNISASVPSDFESIVRSAYVGVSLENDLKKVRSFLKDSARQRKHLAAIRTKEAASISNALAAPSFGLSYRWFRACCDASRLRAETAALLEVAERKDLTRTLRSPRG